MCEWQLSRVADHGDKSELAYGDATLHATLRYTNVTSSNVVSMATAVIVAPSTIPLPTEIQAWETSNSNFYCRFKSSLKLSF